MPDLVIERKQLSKGAGERVLNGNWDAQPLVHMGSVITDVWTKDLATDLDFYDVDYAYGSTAGLWTNLVLSQDNVLQTTAGVHKFDWEYAYDALDRLTTA